MNEKRVKLKDRSKLVNELHLTVTEEVNWLSEPRAEGYNNSEPLT